MKQIFSVDDDISLKLSELVEDTSDLDSAVRAISQAILQGKKIYIYGCGSTGRLAKQMESAVWRPFWKKIKKKEELWKRLESSIPGDIEDLLIGEMTGGDRALISALEGFEDLELVGELQLQERGVERGDVVFCVTEGGETSSVIGAIRAALRQYGNLTKLTAQEAKAHLYFIYNNPDELLWPFERSRAVLETESITKINLTTGPQSIAGSTRMQATTIETFVLGVILEFGIQRVLKRFLSDEELTDLGFLKMTGWKERFQVFNGIRDQLIRSLERLERFTDLESGTYKNENFATYFAKKALITVFIDCAERSPTFHLSPLDTAIDTQRKCRIQVWTEGDDLVEAWQNFLGREYHGLEQTYYKPYFLDRIEDVYLKDAALKSLSQAGNDQKHLYDFSFAEKNVNTRGPDKGDLGVCVCIDEEIDTLAFPDSPSARFIRLFEKHHATLALILIDGRKSKKIEDIISHLNLNPNRNVVIHLRLPAGDDPLGIKRQTLLKMLLNGHSTAVMARLGRVVGNTMTHLNPSNLKLIGRATYLIKSHVNDSISSKQWSQKYGEIEPISYAQANAVLFDAMEFVADRDEQVSEVELSIIRIIEALRNKRFILWEKALQIQKETGLECYLEQQNPELGYKNNKSRSR